VLTDIGGIAIQTGNAVLGAAEATGTMIGQILTPWKRGARDAADAVVDSFNDAEEAADSFNVGLLAGLTTFDDVRQKVLELTDSEHAANLVALEWAETNQDVVYSTDDVGDSVDGASEAFGGAERSVVELTKAEQANADTLNQKMTPAVDEAETAISDLSYSAEDANGNVRLLGDAFHILKNEISDRQSYRDLEDQFDRVEEAAETAFIAASEGAENADVLARNHAGSMDELRLKIIAYGDEVLGLPDEAITNVIAKIDDGALEEAEATLERLRRIRTVLYNPSVLTTSQNNGQNTIAHTGRRIEPGKPYNVLSGETFVPDVPGRVRSREDSQRATAAPAGEIVVKVFIGDTELRGLVRTEVNQNEQDQAAQLRAGTR